MANNPFPFPSHPKLPADGNPDNPSSVGDMPFPPPPLSGRPSTPKTPPFPYPPFTPSSISTLPAFALKPRPPNIPRLRSVTGKLSSRQSASSLFAGQTKTVNLPSRLIACCAGVFMMLIIVPLFDAAQLVSDDHFVFWCGRGVPVAFIGVAGGLGPGVFCAVSYAIVRFGSRRTWNAKAAVLLTFAFLCTLGLVLILFGFALAGSVRDLEVHLLSNRCEFNEKSYELYASYRDLGKVKTKCEKVGKFGEAGVDACSGFADNVYTRYLQHIERSLPCSHLCVDDNVSHTHAPVRPPDPSLLTMERKVADGTRHATRARQVALMREQSPPQSYFGTHKERSERAYCYQTIGSVLMFDIESIEYRTFLQGVSYIAIALGGTMFSFVTMLS